MLLPPLIRAITGFIAQDDTRGLYVITSRHTFSAAQNFVSKLEWLMPDLMFVGEPTGSSPNFTGDLSIALDKLQSIYQKAGAPQKPNVTSRLGRLEAAETISHGALTNGQAGSETVTMHWRPIAAAPQARE